MRWCVHNIHVYEMEGGSWIVETRLLRKKSLTDDTDCLVREEGVCVQVCVCELETGGT